MRLDELQRRGELGLTVRACSEQLHRGIRWVHTTELPDPSQYLEGGELILTNGMWHASPEDAERFVAALARSAVSGLGYGLLAPTLRRVPPDVVAACERHGIPLLEVPRELPFMAISRAVLEDLAEQRQSELRQTVRLSERLLYAARRGAPPADLLRVLADHSPEAWLVTPSGRLLGALGDAPPAAHLRDAARRARACERHPADIVLSDGGAASAFAAAAFGHAEAYLIWPRSIGEVSQAEYAAIDQTLGFLALELAHQRAVRAKEDQFARELVDLIDAGASLHSETVARMRALGLDPHGPLRIVVCSVQEADDDRLEWLAEAQRHFLESRRLASAVPVVRGQAVAIVAWPDAVGDADGAALGRDLAALAIDALDRDVRVSVGVGGLARDAGMLRRSLIEARHACRLAGMRGGVATARDLGSHTVLFAMHDHDVRASFRSAVLGAVLDYDAVHGTELVRTLDVFLWSNGRWQSSADALSIHVNTLRQRLHRVEQLTARDLTRIDDRIDLYLALHAARA